MVHKGMLRCNHPRIPLTAMADLNATPLGNLKILKADEDFVSIMEGQVAVPDNNLGWE